MTLPHSKAIWRHISGNQDYLARYARFTSHVWSNLFQQHQLEECLSWAYELNASTSQFCAPNRQDFLNGKLRIGISLLKLSRFDEAYALLKKVMDVSFTSILIF